MYSPNQKANQPTICDLVPGHAYYNCIGYSLAETLVDLIEWLIGFRR